MIPLSWRVKLSLRTLFWRCALLLLLIAASVGSSVTLVAAGVCDAPAARRDSAVWWLPGLSGFTRTCANGRQPRALWPLYFTLLTRFGVQNADYERHVMRHLSVADTDIRDLPHYRELLMQVRNTNRLFTSLFCCSSQSAPTRKCAPYAILVPSHPWPSHPPIASPNDRIRIGSVIDPDRISD